MFSKFSIKKCSSYQKKLNYKKERRKKRTLTHFNGSRLGKGKADDMANGCALVQNRDKTIDQYLCFAGAGRGGHPHTCGGIRCALLSEGHEKVSIVN